jgi:Fe-coproporphyrin III synthase
MNKNVALPTDCVIAITYGCNARCTMCDIWKIKEPPEFGLEQFEKLPHTLKDINLSGGETFLHNKLPEIVFVVVKQCPKARVVISSNGFAPDLIEKQMKEILEIKPNIGVAISIDGIDKMHDEIRGIPGGYDRAMDTVKRLQDLGMTNLRLSFTIMEENLTHLSRVYDKSRELGIEFTYTFAQSSENYFGGKQIENHPNLQELKKQISYVMNGELRKFSPKSWVRAYFANGLYKFSTTKKQMLSNDPGSKFFFLDPKGDVYPSVVHNFKMGNIYNYQTWSELWQGKEANEARQNVKEKGVPVWMICTARTALKKHPIKIGLWILKNMITGVNLK